MTAELYCISYSPWSEKARWALDHHGVAYRAVPYAPILDEPKLRLRLRRAAGVISAPVLFAGGRVVEGSDQIARWAQAEGTGPALLPAGEAAAIARWEQRAEAALAAGRALGLTRFLQTPRFLASLAPPGLPGPVARPLTAWGIRRTLHKYGADRRSAADHEAAFRSELDALREALGGATERTILPAFSLADVCMAQVFQFIQPQNVGTFRLNRLGREGHRHAGLCADYPDLLAWRQWLYATHRDRGTTRVCPRSAAGT